MRTALFSMFSMIVAGTLSTAAHAARPSRASFEAQAERAALNRQEAETIRQQLDASKASYEREMRTYNQAMREHHSALTCHQRLVSRYQVKRDT